MFAWSNGLSRSAGVGLRQSLAGSPQHQAESSSYPAVWLFASGCFPPCLAATRLPSTTSRNIDSRRTFISLTQHTLHRTSAGIYAVDVAARPEKLPRPSVGPGNSSEPACRDAPSPCALQNPKSEIGKLKSQIPRPIPILAACACTARFTRQSSVLRK